MAVQDYTSPTDLDLANLLYLQNIPNVPDNQKVTLSATWESINSWLAWELTRVEDQVTAKLKTKALPDDDSVESKTKRTQYRIKVVNFFRNESPWLTGFATASQTITVTATEGKINLAVLRALLGVSQIPKVPQIANVLKAVGQAFDVNGSDIVQPHVLYIIDYKSDPVTDTISAVIKTFTFSVTIKEIDEHVTPGKPGKGKDVAPKPKTYEGSIDYSFTAVDFNTKLWDDSAPEDEIAYALGKQLLPEKQLNLVESP